MKRLDLLKLRRHIGISQSQLAKQLDVRPSFLSAIENGRSRFPEDKLGKLKQICGMSDLHRFVTEDDIESTSPVPPHTHPHHHNDSDSVAEKIYLEQIHYLRGHIERLENKIENLYTKIENLSTENARLTIENTLLKKS